MIGQKIITSLPVVLPNGILKSDPMCSVRTVSELYLVDVFLEKLNLDYRISPCYIHFYREWRPGSEKYSFATYTDSVLKLLISH